MTRRNGKAKGELRTIIVVSDTHCGDRLGLCPPDGVPLDDGGEYHISALQQKVWAYWREFWDEWVPSVTQGEPFAVVCNGDIINGIPHGAVTNISNNLEDQCEIAYRVFLPIVERCNGQFYMVRGTEAHVSKSAREEESLGKRLNAIPTAEGQHSHWELNKRLGTGVVNLMHHIGITSSSAHETSAINAELAAAFVESGRWGHDVPDVLVRSHRHRCAEVRIPTERGYAIAFVTPAWQLKTPFSYKIAARMTAPQFGGSMIRCGVEEALYTRHFVKNVVRAAPI